MHRHGIDTRKLGRAKQPRELMLRNLATSIVLHEKVKTTLPKAKAIRSQLEKMITVAKKGDLAATRKLNSYFLDVNASQKLLKELAPLYAKRNGGYLRITKIGPRVGDNAEMVFIEFLDTEKLVKKVKGTIIKEPKEEKTKKVGKKLIQTKAKVQGKKK